MNIKRNIIASLIACILALLVPSAAPAGDSVAQSPDKPEAELAARPVRLLFGGDVTLSSGYIELVPEPHKDFKWPFRRLEPLMSEIDLLMVNFESAITTHDEPEDKSFVFKADPVMVNVLRQNKIGIVTLGNNHAFDYGPVGLADTLRALDEAGIAHVGAGMSLADARRPVMMEMEGIRIAFLGYGNYSPAGRSKPGVAYRYRDHVAADIKAARKSGAEIIIVNFHWGEEKATAPTPEDRSLAHLAVDSGADVVVGHHPHVLQPVEIYKGRVIAYSLGNFIFGGNSYRPRDSALLKVTIHQDRRIEHELIDIIIDPQETRYQPYVAGKPEPSSGQGAYPEGGGAIAAENITGVKQKAD